MIKLNSETVLSLPSAVQGPTYDRRALTPGIVHIGLGNFHRGHQQWYLHRLMQDGLAHDWAIIGAGVRPYDAGQREKLARQDYLTTLIELGPEGTSAEVVGPMIDYVPIVAGNDPLIRQMADPAIRIVALSVTEGGYYIDPATKGLDAQHRDVQHDAANPQFPCTAFGAIVAALKLRCDAGSGPFTVLSCDNLQGNGDILRQTVVGLAQLSDPALGEWIAKNCTFPNSMVDCIVPATGPQELDLVRSLGVEDAAPVTHENFRQWVIEDDFCAGRPDWDKVGATFSGDVHGYEDQKIRILNAGHQVIAGAAEMLGINTISEAMAHELIHGMFRKVALTEIAPLVQSVPGMTPQDYVDLIDRRFSNPAIADTTQRVAFDGSSRHPGFVLPTLRDALASGASIDGLALVQAFWARMCAGTREDGSYIQPNDPNWDKLTQTAKAAQRAPMRWLEMNWIYGDLRQDKRFSDAFAHWLDTIYNDGTNAAMRQYLKVTK